MEVLKIDSIPFLAYICSKFLFFPFLLLRRAFVHSVAFDSCVSPSRCETAKDRSNKVLVMVNSLLQYYFQLCNS